MVKKQQNLILLIDYNSNYIKFLFNHLQASGFKVVNIQKNRAIIEQIQSLKPDLILLNIFLPEGDSLAICRQLQNTVLHLPIILYGKNSNCSAAEALGAGAVDYWAEPLAINELIARIKRHLRLKNQYQQLHQELEARKKVQNQLQKLTKNLQQQIEQRKIELAQTNEKLQQTQIKLLQQEEKLRQETIYDRFTGVANRAFLTKLLERLIHLGQRDSSFFFAVLCVEIDWQPENAHSSLHWRERLLPEIARRLQTCLRKTDTISRYDRDQFVILLEQIRDVQEVVKVVQRIQTQLASPFDLSQQKCEIATSIGIGIRHGQLQQAQQILQQAEASMQYAKTIGQNRYALFDCDIQNRLIAGLQLENYIRQALQRQDFQLYYQPIFRLSTRSIVGFETLLRWYHPEEGWIAPDKFIPLAEKYGIINELGWWILRSVCEQGNQWRRQFPDKNLTITVNFSTVQLKQVSLVSELAKILQSSGFPARNLRIDLPETVLLKTVSLEFQQLKELKQLGVNLCIDNFGAGYLALAHLKLSGVDTLKIDRSLISTVETELNSFATVKMLIAIAASLNLDIIAQGVETAESHKILKKLGCDLVQGYLFASALDPHSATRSLIDQHQI